MILLGVFEEVDELHDLLLGVVHTRYMLEASLDLLVDTVDLNVGLAHTEDVAEAPAALTGTRTLV